jgi:hypothetical protein
MTHCNFRTSMQAHRSGLRRQSLMYRLRHARRLNRQPEGLPLLLSLAIMRSDSWFTVMVWERCRWKWNA